MKDDCGDIFVGIVAAILTTVLFLLISIFTGNIKNEEWNNGYCDCGGNWTYEQAVGHACITKYMYKCDQCNKRREFSEIYEQEVD